MYSGIDRQLFMPLSGPSGSARVFHGSILPSWELIISLKSCCSKLQFGGLLSQLSLIDISNKIRGYTGGFCVYCILMVTRGSCGSVHDGCVACQG
jgi:hypothetical protein